MDAQRWFPIVAVALSGCPYISDTDHTARVAGLDTDRPEPIDLNVLELTPQVFAACEGPTAVHVDATVAVAYADTEFEVFVGIDSASPTSAGAATADSGFDDTANLVFDANLDVSRLGECGDAACAHDVTVGVRASNGLDAEAAPAAFSVIPAWKDHVEVVGVSVIDEDGASTAIDDPGFADLVGTNPTDGVSVDALPEIGVRLAHPWFAAGGDLDGWAAVVAACPAGASPGDEACHAVDAALAYGADGVIAIAPTLQLAAAACAAPADPYPEVWIGVSGDACDAETQWVALFDTFRLVRDDCDGDAMTVADGDCDDANSDRYPGNPDLDCDGVDQNCSGDEADTGFGVDLHADKDGDQFGDAAVAAHDCAESQPTLVTDATDCDDDDGAVYPGAPETCDGVDSNCVGGESDATDTANRYVDADGDKFGKSGSAPISGCAGALTATDCDDTRGDVNPGAPEVCDVANEDEDCDSKADDLDSNATGQVSWSPDVDNDGYGALGSTSTKRACDKPAGYGPATDCNDGNPNVSPGDPEVCDSVPIDEDCDGKKASACDNGDLCNDDLGCASGSCDGGRCVPWALFAKGAGDEPFESDVAVTSTGTRVWALRSDSAAQTLVIGGKTPPAGSYGQFDWVIARVDSDGAVRSVSRFGGSGDDVAFSAVAATTGGRYAVAGSANVNVVLRHDTTIVPAVGLNAVQAWVLVFNSDDTLAWSWMYGGAATDEARAAAFAADGDLFVAMILDRPNDDGAVARVNPNGSTDWVKIPVGTGESRAFAVAAHPSGDVIVAGQFGDDPSPALAFGAPCGVLSNSAGNADGFVARLNGVTGACVWARALNGVGDQRISDVAVDASGDVFVVGSTIDSAALHTAPTCALGGVVATTPSAALGGSDVVVGKLDANGSPIWLRVAGSAGNDLASGIAIDLAGDPVVAGAFGSAEPGHPDFGLGVVPFDAGYEPFVARFAAATGASDAFTAFTGPGDEDLAYGVSVDPITGDWLVTGTSNGMLDLGTGPTGDTGFDLAGTPHGGWLVSLGTSGGPSRTPFPTCSALGIAYPQLPNGSYPIDENGPYGAVSMITACTLR